MTTAMITRCAHCGTAFRVYEHQLEKREGQVRCGACGEVFDAYDSLEAEREPVEAPAVDEAAQEPSVVAPKDAVPTAVEPSETSVAEEAPSYVSDDGGDYDFGPHRPGPDRRPAYVGAIVVAAALLAIQTVLWFRSDLAARFAPLRAPLEALCRVAACEITLPAVAEQISIESSDLQSDGEYLVLVATLRNKASFTQAFPAVELTLTDARDQPLARRILRPEDYLDPSVRPQSGVASGAEVLARVYMDASGLNATSYRMLVFYP